MAFRIGGYGPAHQPDAAVFDLDAGDALRMDAASVIEIGTGTGPGENRSVGVAGYNDPAGVGCIGAELPFNFFHEFPGAARACGGGEHTLWRKV